MGDRKEMGEKERMLRILPHRSQKYPTRARLFSERIKRRMSIEDVKAIGILKSHYHRIEVGEWDPSPDIAIALEEKLGVPRRSLLKKYEKLLGIPRHKCSIHRKRSFIAVISWEPFYEIRRRFRELVNSAEE
jgi:transcriptional regulator with XRE-family HTH domain